jgi:hypothetical protein
MQWGFGKPLTEEEFKQLQKNKPPGTVTTVQPTDLGMGGPSDQNTQRVDNAQKLQAKLRAMGDQRK